MTLAASLFFGSAVQAQTQKQTQKQTQTQQNDALVRQEIREKAILTIQKGYETYATCRNADYQNEFLQLFVNANVPVFNDLLGLSTERTLTVGRYARLLGGGAVKNTIVTISGISILDEPYKENDKWKIDVAFNKRMSYFDGCGVYYNSYDFYQADYNLEVTLQYDAEENVCRIERITGGIDSFAELPDKFFVFKQTDERDRQLLYHRTPLKFNSGKQAFVEGEYDPKAFTHASPKVKQLIPTIDSCNIVTMRYDKKAPSDPFKSKGPKPLLDYSFLLKPHFDLGLGGLSVDGSSDISSSSSTMGFGVDFGMPIMNSGSLKLNAFAGIGLNMSSIDLDYKTSGMVTVNNVEDLDGDSYERRYEGLSISQTVKLTELAIPVYVDAEIDLASGLCFYGDLGARLNFNMSNSADVNAVETDKISGYYRQYGVTLDESWGFEGFKNTHTTLNATTTGDLSGVSGMTFDIIGGAGLRYYIPNSPVALDLGVKFQLGMSEMIKSENDSQQNSNTIISYKNKEEQVSSLTDMLTSVKRNLLALSIGLVFKF